MVSCSHAYRTENMVNAGVLTPAGLNPTAYLVKVGFATKRLHREKNCLQKAPWNHPMASSRYGKGTEWLEHAICGIICVLPRYAY